MRPLKLDGKRFGKLIVLYRTTGSPRSYWQCRCDCGKLKVIMGKHLMSKGTTSCGCLHTQRFTTFKHGHDRREQRSPEYRAWLGARRRCNSTKSKDFIEWGGRGITICPRWGNFLNFLRDMGKRPTPRHSLDRINNDGNYEPSNCRWASQYEQAQNRRKRRVPYVRGVTGQFKTPSQD